MSIPLPPLSKRHKFKKTAEQFLLLKAGSKSKENVVKSIQVYYILYRGECTILTYIIANATQVSSDPRILPINKG
jgi:hypothetical protein